MAEQNHNDRKPSKCPQCGQDLPPNLNSGLCPQCLLNAALETQPASQTALPRGSQALLHAGEDFGHYTIGRTLGQGGMGAVYEAQDLESGRRVALKILSQALDSPEARERFFREGRLAASINDPHSVYIFGTEEIGGIPVITMELMDGGTLQDRVRQLGPLPPTEAVDAVLQIISGLEAAHSVGILHRDIKPSNCFVGPGGTVKIGDFGLSISATIRTEPALTATGQFIGTPAFCSPEQLRGDELTSRSDMYSVGATLFYLLTGRTPFEADSVVQMLATMLEHKPPSPRDFRKSIPQDLARIVLRCLEKSPGDRFRSYADLSAALAAYSSIAPTPATLGWRIVAGCADWMLLSAVGAFIAGAFFGSSFQIFEKALEGSKVALLFFPSWFLGLLAFYGVLEGIYGASPGKFICRLRVIRSNRNPPGFFRAAVRAAFCMILPAVPYWIALAVGGHQMILAGKPSQFVWSFSFYVVLGLLFITVRRRNGFAAVHDLLTGTRVVSKTSLTFRARLPAEQASPAVNVPAGSTVGPYQVLDVLEKNGPDEWLLGYDLRLLRKVWLHRVAPGTPPYPYELRNLSRPTRLRWLTGKRSHEENWDSFEAPSGKPLESLASSPQAWADVRFWLFDLATELAAAARDNTTPATLAPDRVWVTSDGRAKLLDFRAPGLGTTSSADPPSLRPPSIEHSQSSVFLWEIANFALGGKTGIQPRSSARLSLPLHARTFIDRLAKREDPGNLATQLRNLLGKPAVITRARRAGVIAACVCIPLVGAVSSFVMGKVMAGLYRTDPVLTELQSLVQVRSGFKYWRQPAGTPTDDQFATYIAAHYAGAITNPVIWNSGRARLFIPPDGRAFAEKSIAEHRVLTPAQVQAADAAVGPLIRMATMYTFVDQPWLPFVIFWSTLAFLVGVPALVAALAFRGGILQRFASIAYVVREGSLASRGRLFVRALLSWSVLFIVLGLFWAARQFTGNFIALMLSSSAAAVLAVLSLSLPLRGLPDRLAGTWPVIR